MVADTLSRWVWSFSVQPDGSLANGVPFYRLEIPDEVESGPLRSGADGMTVDTDGFLYVATKLGIQIVDPAGKTVGILQQAGQQRPLERSLRRRRPADAVCHVGGQGLPPADQEKRHVPMGGGRCRRSHGCDRPAIFALNFKLCVRSGWLSESCFPSARRRANRARIRERSRSTPSPASAAPPSSPPSGAAAWPGRAQPVSASALHDRGGRRRSGSCRTSLPAATRAARIW